MTAQAISTRQHAHSMTKLTLCGVGLAAAASFVTADFLAASYVGPLCENQAKRALTASDFSKVSKVTLNLGGPLCKAELSDGTIRTWSPLQQHEKDSDSHTLTLNRR